MSKLIDIVDSPQDLKKLPVDKLPDLAREIRDMLLDTISKTGGHLSSNLGVVELTMAMQPPSGEVQAVTFSCGVDGVAYVEFE